jgi:hypothetical protein
MAPQPLETARQILKHIFNTPTRKRRLRLFLGCKATHLYKLLSGERASLPVRYLQLVELAYRTDPHGARRLAELPLDYYGEMIAGAAAARQLPSNRAQSIRLITEHAEALAAFNHRELPEMTDEEMVTAYQEMQDLRHEVRVAYEAIQAEVSRRCAARHGREVATVAARTACLSGEQTTVHSSRSRSPLLSGGKL